jgi:hypothetical protein
MSDTFCIYGEAGSLYGGDDYGLCGTRGVRSCEPGDDPVTKGTPADPTCDPEPEC